MKLYLTGEPCTQQRHCYFVEGESASFIMDCGYQRCYRGDELPHLLPDQIRAARYLFLSHSHENQSGALPYLLSNGFTGRVVLTTETARQLPLGIDDPIVLEGLSVPYAEAPLPGGISLTWGRSGHCSGSVWFRMAKTGARCSSPAIITTARVCMPAIRLKGSARISPCWTATTACSRARPRATPR